MLGKAGRGIAIEMDLGRYYPHLEIGKFDHVIIFAYKPKAYPGGISLSSSEKPLS